MLKMLCYSKSKGEFLMNKDYNAINIFDFDGTLTTEK